MTADITFDTSQLVDGSTPALPKDGEQVTWRLRSPKTGDEITVTGLVSVRPPGAVDPPGTNPGPNDFFVTSHGGEYFFVPSILALKRFAGVHAVAGTSSSL